jgi:CRISPR/Cas system CMR-associated protein Cmr3 (group 5 of RAMP superfamily)
VKKIIFALCFLASIAHAEQYESACKGIASISEEIMDARQNNVPKFILIDHANLNFSGMENRIYTILVNDAYKLKVEQYINGKREAIKRFKKLNYDICLEAGK